MNDARYTLRILRKAPLFTLAVVLTLALAIGANIAIFSIVNAVLVHPLPFKDPSTLVQAAEKNDKLHLPIFGTSVLNFIDWRNQSHSFEQLGAISYGTYTLTGSGDPEQLSGNPISPALTRVLGLQPVAGRDFNSNEEKPGAPRVAMISEGLWKRRFGSDPNLIGRTITLDGQATTVVGIAPTALSLLSGGDIYTPLLIDPAKENRLNHINNVFARLKPGVSLAQAQAEMNAISVRNGQVHPEIRDWGIRLITLEDTFVSSDLKTGLLVLMSAVLLVLLIACANIANLLLARAATRQSEMAMRTALGATRRRLIRQLLIESIALCCGGGALGLLTANGALRLLNHVLPPGTLPIPTITMDANVTWFAVGITLFTGFLFGLAPALAGSRSNLTTFCAKADAASLVLPARVSATSLPPPNWPSPPSCSSAPACCCKRSPTSNACSSASSPMACSPSSSARLSRSIPLPAARRSCSAPSSTTSMPFPASVAPQFPAGFPLAPAITPLTPCSPPGLRCFHPLPLSPSTGASSALATSRP